MRLFLKRRAENQPNSLAGFYAIFSIGLLFVAIEEISRGQWFFEFATPKIVADNNVQGDLTLHNLKVWHDYIETLPLIFGPGGLSGFDNARSNLFDEITPSILLAP